MENEHLLSSLRAAVEGSPEDPALRTHLARMLLLAGHGNEALEHALAAARLVPDDAEVADLVREIRAEEPAPEEAAPDFSPASDAHDPGEVPGRTGPGKRLSLADVAGMETVKARLESEFLAPARNPQLAERYGKQASGGLLLYGPPGCGKTYVARALAGELGAAFIPIDSAMVVSSHPGQSAQRLSQLFDEARRNAPSLLFFDEVDAVAMRRSALETAAWLRSMVNQLLAELDGFGSNAGVFVVGATNAPWDVDPAMRRPGRFDRVVCVLPPDRAARRAIFETHLRGRPVSAVDVAALGDRTEGFSGADIAHVVEEAASSAFAAAMKSGTEVDIDQKMLRAALSDIRPSVGAWLEQAKNHVLFANKDGTLDDLAAYMREHRML